MRSTGRRGVRRSYSTCGRPHTRSLSKETPVFLCALAQSFGREIIKLYLRRRVSPLSSKNGTQLDFTIDGAKATLIRNPTRGRVIVHETDGRVISIDLKKD